MLNDIINYAQQNNCIIELQQFTTTQFLIIGFFTFIVSIVLHELGHWIMLYRYREDVKIRFGIVDKKIFIGSGLNLDYKKLTKEQKLEVYAVGIIAGIIPIILTAFIFNIAFLLLLAPYIIGIIKDLKLLYKCLEHSTIK